MFFVVVGLFVCVFVVGFWGVFWVYLCGLFLHQSWSTGWNEKYPSHRKTERLPDIWICNDAQSRLITFIVVSNVRLCKGGGGGNNSSILTGGGGGRCSMEHINQSCGVYHWATITRRIAVSSTKYFQSISTVNA